MVEEDNENTKNDKMIAEEGIWIDEPTLGNVNKIIKRNKIGKAARDSNINMQLIKLLGEMLHAKPQELIKEICRKEKMLKEWEERIVVTIHKKERCDRLQ